MKIFHLQQPIPYTRVSENGYSLAVGFFDGLHRGHQAVIKAAQKRADELNIQSAVMTFDPHPSYLFGGPNQQVRYITEKQEKIRILEGLGIDTLFIVKFDWELAKLTPAQFIDAYFRNLNVKHVTAGFDFTFGANGQGTMETMAQLANGDFGTTIVEKVTDDATEKISSTRIRQLLATGEVASAATLLGRPYRTSGEVIDGDKRGRLLGFPTANIAVSDSAVLPMNGVYAVRFIINDEVFDAVCNIGVKPTFQKGDAVHVVIEVHVLDFNEDLYGKQVSVEWIDFIRAEQKFESVDALIEQIKQDKETARNRLQK